MAHGRQTFLNSAADMRWLGETHLTLVAVGKHFKSAILYGNEDWPSRIELFKAKNPKVTDTCVVYENVAAGRTKRYVYMGTSKPGIG